MKVEIVSPPDASRTENTLNILEHVVAKDEYTSPQLLLHSTITPELWTPDRIEQSDTFIVDLDEPHYELARDLKLAVGLGKAAIAFIPRQADVTEFFGNFEMPQRDKTDRAVLPPTSWYLAPRPGYSVHQLVVRKRQGKYIQPQQLQSWFSSTLRQYQLQQANIR